jgi:hypothetical protein
MTSEHLIGFFERRPFVPFVILLVTSREYDVRHPEVAYFTRGGLAVMYYHATGHTEVIDAAHIVSLCTLKPSTTQLFTEG